MNRWQAQTRELALMLTQWQSITNSAGERDLPYKLRDYLSTTPYFEHHPDQLTIMQTMNDPYERSNLFALVRGSGHDTLMLAGHYDTVSIANYGDLQAWACDPEALTPCLIETLRQSTNEHDQQALRDLESGDFLAGRGLLDMKSGIAAGLAVLLAYAEQPERTINLMLLITPDEENASHGMRSAVQMLPSLCQQWNMTIEAAINLDATSDHGDGSLGQAAFLGTVGKFLPTVLVVGQDTHAGYPFDGLSASALAASIVQQIECNPALCDVYEGETAPAPVCLKVADLKEYYDVTTPAMAWCYFNLLTHGRTASEVLHLTMAHVEQAMDDYLSLIQQRARQANIAIPDWQMTTYSFADVIEQIAMQRKQSASDVLHELLEIVDDPQLDTPTLTCRMMQTAWQWSNLQAPAAVVSFGSLHYPHSFLREQSRNHARLKTIIHEQTAQLAHELNTSICVRGFFSGISDMSFVGGSISADDETMLAANTPLWTTRLQMDYAVVRELNIPMVNIGPWGRDYHQRNERLYTPYAFNTLPELLWRIVQAWEKNNE